jgi:uncharacterized protein
MDTCQDCHDSGRSLSEGDEQRLGRVLGAFDGVRALYLFGSFADGTARADSDIDLAIVPADESVRDRQLEMLTELVRAGYDRIDLVFLSVRDTVLRYHAVRCNRPLYVAPGFSHPEYFTRALNEYWDLEPLLRARHAEYRRQALSG